ncbi:MAG: hypothetical protein H0X29_03350 [Parachlamydiaceae bacterium]|nr:hypothetical protein [Parachlamydiaceae bacterium]
MKVVEKIALFGPGCSEIGYAPHKATSGTTVGKQVSKATEFVRLNFNDVMQPHHEPFDSKCKFNFAENQYASSFLKTGKQLSNVEVFGYISSLKNQYKTPQIKILFNSLVGGFNKIKGLDPLFLLTGTEAPSDIDQNWLLAENKIRMEEEPVTETDKNKGLNPSLIPFDERNLEDIDKSWLLVENEVGANIEQISEIERSREQQLAFQPFTRFEEDYIVYPFVFPRKSVLSCPHIILIIVDQLEKKIYYYDSQGLTSDDPSRLELFEDHLKFNMHENLVLLAETLFKDCESEIIENVAMHQSDPVSCGVFVSFAVEKILQGKSIPEALNYNPLEETITDARKRMGLAYMRAMQEIEKNYSQEAAMQAIEKKYSRRYSRL